MTFGGGAGTFTVVRATLHKRLQNKREHETAMKLNFWQWLGVVLVVVGLIWFIYSRRAQTTTTTPAPADLPAATSPTP